MAILSSESGYYCLGDSKVRSVDMGIPYAQSDDVHPALDFRVGVCECALTAAACRNF